MLAIASPQTVNPPHLSVLGIGHNLVQASRVAIIESRAVIAEADRLLVLYADYIRPLAFACATMTRAVPRVL